MGILADGTHPSSVRGTAAIGRSVRPERGTAFTLNGERPYSLNGAIGMEKSIDLFDNCVFEQVDEF